MKHSIHPSFVKKATQVFSGDDAIDGLAIGGSWMDGTWDEFSDLDFYVICNKDHFSFEEKRQKFELLGKLLTCYPNGHDDRVIITLYDYTPILLHVDWKWIPIEDFYSRVENPIILFERNNLLSKTIIEHPSKGYPLLDLGLTDKRFWSWMHYILAKIGRGEILEAYSYLCEAHCYGIAPLLLQYNHCSPRRLRHVESLPAEEFAQLFASYPQAYSAAAILDAVSHAIQLYVRLRNELWHYDFLPQYEAEKACLQYAQYIGTLLKS